METRWGSGRMMSALTCSQTRGAAICNEVRATMRYVRLGMDAKGGPLTQGRSIDKVTCSSGDSLGNPMVKSMTILIVHLPVPVSREYPRFRWVGIHNPSQGVVVATCLVG
jgi:hypothetical protein